MHYAIVRVQGLALGHSNGDISLKFLVAVISMLLKFSNILNGCRIGNLDYEIRDAVS